MEVASLIRHNRPGWLLFLPADQQSCRRISSPTQLARVIRAHPNNVVQHTVETPVHPYHSKIMIL